LPIPGGQSRLSIITGGDEKVEREKKEGRKINAIQAWNEEKEKVTGGSLHPFSFHPQTVGRPKLNDYGK